MSRKLTPTCVLCTADLPGDTAAEGHTSASHPSDTAPSHPRSQNHTHSSKVPTLHPDRHCTLSSEVPKPHLLIQGPIAESEAAKPGGHTSGSHGRADLKGALGERQRKWIFIYQLLSIIPVRDAAVSEDLGKGSVGTIGCCRRGECQRAPQHPL